MEEIKVLKKKVVLEVDGEVVTIFPVFSLPSGERFEMLEAALASNPVLRLVEHASPGQHWDGEKYV